LGISRDIAVRTITLVVAGFCAGLEIFEHALRASIIKAHQRRAKYEVVRVLSWENAEDVINVAEGARNLTPWAIQSEGNVKNMGRHLIDIELVAGTNLFCGGGTLWPRCSPAISFLADDTMVGLHTPPTNVVYTVALALAQMAERHPSSLAYIHDLTKPYHGSIGLELSRLLGEPWITEACSVEMRQVMRAKGAFPRARDVARLPPLGICLR